MADYPNALDALTNPAGGQPMNTPGVLHSVQHATANDILEALEAKLGLSASPASAAVVGAALRRVAWGTSWVFDMAVNALDYAKTAAQRAVLGDGLSKPLSGFYASLAAAQVDYPHATALTNELDWAVLQAASNACIGPGAISTVRQAIRPLHIPAGNYRTDTALLIQSVQGFRLSGSGKDQTRITYAGAAALDYCIKIDGSADGIFEKFSVSVTGAGIVDVIVGLEWTSGTIARSSSANTFRDVVVYATGNKAKYGFGVGAHSAGVQVDGTAFYDCLANGGFVLDSGVTTTSQAGFKIGSGTFGNILDTVLFNSFANGWAIGVNGDASNYWAYGGQPAANQVDYHASVAETTTIEGIRSEGSRYFLVTDGTSAIGSVRLADISFHGNQMVIGDSFIKMLFGNMIVDGLNVTGVRAGATAKIGVVLSADNPAMFVGRNIVMPTPLATAFVTGPGTVIILDGYTYTAADTQSLAQYGRIVNRKAKGFEQNAVTTLVAPYRSGFWAARRTANGASIAAEGQMHVTPLRVAKACSIDRIGVFSTVAGSAGALVRLGIYKSDADGFPAALLLDAGTVDATAAPGMLSININQALEPGLYWLAAVIQGAAATRPTLAVTNNAQADELVLAGTTWNQFAQAGYMRNGVAGALPSPFVFDSSTGSAIIANVRYV